MEKKLDKSDKNDFLLTTWKEVKPGDEVYLMGTQLGHFRAYGPHTVVDLNKMTLKTPSEKNSSSTKKYLVKKEREKTQ